MKKLKFFSLTLIAFSILLVRCNKPEQEFEPEPSFSSMKDGSTCEVILYAAQTIDVGTVDVTFNTSDEIIVTYTINNSDWCVIETHLDVQSDPANFPQTKKGNPKVGHFAYGQTLGCVSSWSQTIDLNNISGWNTGDEVFIAAHAEVRNLSNQVESAWSCCDPFPGNNWAMYFSCTQPQWGCGDPLIDERDGQSYNTVLIGDQCWMAENLNIGGMIDRFQSQTQNTPDEIMEKHCYNNDENNCDIYGGLYQWNEMMQYATTPGLQGICPAGWHIPTDEEWKVLEGSVDSEYPVGDPHWDIITYRGTDAGTNLKTTNGWYYGNGTDLFGFSCLPGGWLESGYLNGIGGGGAWWSATEEDADWAWYRGLDASYAYAYRNNYPKSSSFSVRCLKD